MKDFTVDASTRIERALTQTIIRAGATCVPPALLQAVQHAVFPAGARIRPRLCLAVAQACAEDAPQLTDSAAAAIELIHCASLVHDDLPCFDDAPTRRGKPSVHRAYGVPLAVLAGDALIVLAFETLAMAGAANPERLAPLLLTLSQATGMPGGIIAGQALEGETEVALSDYQCAKTGALFAAATAAGAVAAGHPVGGWKRLGERLGEAYQVADDIRDIASTPAELGKPTGRDAVLGRPNAVAAMGLAAAIHHLKRLVDEAIAAIPACPGAGELEAHILAEAAGLLPMHLRSAA